jgi:hypothetical protein
VKLTDEPAATDTVVVLLPSERPPTLHLKSFDERSVTGELLLVFLRMFWYNDPLAPLAVRYSKMSTTVSHYGSLHEDYTRTVAVNGVQEA